MPQDTPSTCNGCSKRFLIKHTLSCPKGGLVLARHDDAEKEWGVLGDRSLIPSAINYEPKINSRTRQGERTGAGSQYESGTEDDGAEIVGEAQGVVDGQ